MKQLNKKALAIESIVHSVLADRVHDGVELIYIPANGSGVYQLYDADPTQPTMTYGSTFRRGGNAFAVNWGGCSSEISEVAIREKTAEAIDALK